jgi:hypothetical protein
MNAKTLLAALLVSGAAVFGASQASAMPMAPDHGFSSAPIENVAYGCGPGFSRNPWGRCVPMGPRYVRPYYGRPVYRAPYRAPYRGPYRRY